MIKVSIFKRGNNNQPLTNPKKLKNIPSAKFKKPKNIVGGISQTTNTLAKKDAKEKYPKFKSKSGKTII